LLLATDPAGLTTRTAPAYFVGLLAAARGRRVAVGDRPDGFRLNLIAQPR
jgi:hypothetical protein